MSNTVNLESSISCPGDPTEWVCSSLAFTHCALPEALRAISDLGFSGAELAVRGDGVWPGHVDADALLQAPGKISREIQAAMDSSGVQISSAGFHVSDRHPLQAELERFNATCELVASVGGKAISVFLLASVDATAEARYAAFAHAAEASGVRLFVETHRNTLTENPQDALRWAQQLGARLNLDYDHYRSQGYGFADYEPLLPFVGMMQIREAEEPRLEDHCLPILGAGFSGQITLEHLQMPGESRDLSPTLSRIREAMLCP
ncbi:MAG: sugar phosphate isomerase/epimerase family protein [Verrucomicrobiota bacterium]